jgi:hypothetical protein
MAESSLSKPSKITYLSDRFQEKQTLATRSYDSFWFCISGEEQGKLRKKRARNGRLVAD